MDPKRTGQPFRAAHASGTQITKNNHLQANKAPCRFFFSSQGCKHGADCSFSHDRGHQAGSDDAGCNTHAQRGGGLASNAGGGGGGLFQARGSPSTHRPVVASATLPVCRFFNTPEGCRRADKCPYLHSLPTPSSGGGNGASVRSNPSTEPSPKISSGSQDGGGGLLQLPSPMQRPQQDLRRLCRFHGTREGCRRGSDCPFEHLPEMCGNHNSSNSGDGHHHSLDGSSPTPAEAEAEQQDALRERFSALKSAAKAAKAAKKHSPLAQPADAAELQRLGKVSLGQGKSVEFRSPSVGGHSHTVEFEVDESSRGMGGIEAIKTYRGTYEKRADIITLSLSSMHEVFDAYFGHIDETKPCHETFYLQYDALESKLRLLDEPPTEIK